MVPLLEIFQWTRKNSSKAFWLNTAKRSSRIHKKLSAAKRLSKQIPKLHTTHKMYQKQNYIMTLKGVTDKETMQHKIFSPWPST